MRPTRARWWRGSLNARVRKGSLSNDLFRPRHFGVHALQLPQGAVELLAIHFRKLQRVQPATSVAPEGVAPRTRHEIPVQHRLHPVAEPCALLYECSAMTDLPAARARVGIRNPDFRKEVGSEQLRERRRVHLVRLDLRRGDGARAQWNVMRQEEGVPPAWGPRGPAPAICRYGGCAAAHWWGECGGRAPRMGCGWHPGAVSRHDLSSEAERWP